MTAALPARSAPPDAVLPVWRGDPTLLVYATRWALGGAERAGSHAPAAVSAAIVANREQLPDGARRALVRAITGWTDGRGARASAVARAPWIRALAALGVARSIVRAETPR